jgi:predicted lipid-binding transport protein (Tim44 family)
MANAVNIMITLTDLGLFQPARDVFSLYPSRAAQKSVMFITGCSGAGRDIRYKTPHIALEPHGSRPRNLKGFIMSFSRLAILAFAVTAAFAVVAVDLAEARMRGSFGSRGSRTYTAPPATNTAPRAAPMERSMAPKPTAGAQSIQPGAQASRFGGWRGMLMGGLFVAALGSIFGFGALASGLGFLLQLALIAGAIYLVVSFFRSRRQPALAGGPAGRSQYDFSGGRAMGGGGGASLPLKVGQADLDAFERLLGEIQTAYSREDADQLGARVTPEMLSYFLEELAANAKKGERNEVSGVKLLQGDIAESWREDSVDYATVAMRYAHIDVTRDRATGRVISGDAERPVEATELWTFRRDGGADWELSAIQQTA